MGFFGYYALHSFVNQLKKLFKTWVLIFILVCGLMGGLIGYGASVLEDTIEEAEDTTEIVQEEPEPEFQLSISGDALLELIAGGLILGTFLFEAFSADKNGGKIFLPADVNLLFPSPMKPQSVLMFRLATQLGMALAVTIYMVIQLPNLIYNLGLSPWAAGAILITLFATILIGKLLQVLLYTVCSTHSQFKQYLRKGLYALIALLALGFLIAYKSGEADLLVAADRFFNAPFTRWIPFWGWLKGLIVFVSAQNWPMAALCLGLLIAAGAALVWFIWNINADFYEDAMAKSEETAALMEKAQSEKTSGTAVTRQRKKDRKDSLRRDGMTRGWGADVFFWKTMYNRFRFSHFGFFTKTMETYFAAALGMAAVTRFFYDSQSVLPVMLTLGVLVFFRAMGNPLAEDTGMDFFRLIPQSTWQKLFFSLLGGTVSSLLDLILPVLAASALLMVNPLKLLCWLPLIVSVDFYATSVVAFIDLSVPASIGKTIKQLITILFIYFGLLPDIGLLAFGIALGYTLPAAVGSTVLNLGLGFLAFSLASVFLQPKGKDYIPQVENLDLPRIRKQFSRIGGILCLMACVVIGLQLGIASILSGFFPEVMEGIWGIWLVSVVPQYVIAMPLAIWLLRKIPGEAPRQQPLGTSRGVKYFFICVLAMYGGNLIGTLMTTLIGLLQGSQVTNPLLTMVTGENLFAQFFFVVVMAPLFEEYIFRKLLIDRFHPYGAKTAILMSGLLFGLYHGNFSQFFYAFGLGLIFAYIYLNTGKLRNTVIAHMLVNFMGSFFAPELAKRLPQEIAENAPLPGIYVAFLSYAGFLIVASLVGLVLLCINARNLKFPAGSKELPKGKRLWVTCCNPGMIFFAIVCAGLFVLSLVGG